MASATALYAATVARLKAIRSITVYEGRVPDSPPADSDGKVYPYAVLWASGGVRPPESRSLEADATTDLTWRAPVTVAAGEVNWVLQAADLVRSALEGQVLAAHAGPLEEEPSGAATTVQVDPDVSPTRLYLPMSFTCTTA